MIMKRFFLGILLGAVPFMLSAQENVLKMKYRDMVLEYNQDIKSSEYNKSISKEMKTAAKADFLPQISGNANFNYTGNPAHLTVDLSGLGESVDIEGRNMKYGASISLAQPIYAGGAVKAGYDRAKRQMDVAGFENERIMNNVAYDADVHYWNLVAQNEMVGVAEQFRNSVAELVDVVKQRVDVEYADRNDLLMAEVKLNDAEFQLLRAKNNSEVARLALNSYAGVSPDTLISVDRQIEALHLPMSDEIIADSVAALRPELKIADGLVDIKRSESKIANAKYLPNFSLGFEGSYGSPGYDFKADMDPNYAVYLKLSVPIYDWGKRRSTRRIGNLNVNIAEEKYSTVRDNVSLEIETALCSYNQAVTQVVLTESSLSKARESEEMAMDKYEEGSISIIEVLNAQFYHQQAQINYIQSKLNAQIALSAYERAVGSINIK